MNGHVMFYSIMFDKYLFPLFAVMVVFVRAKASVRPHIFDNVTMHEVVKGDVF